MPRTRASGAVLRRNYGVRLKHRAARFAHSHLDIDPLLDPRCLTLRFALQIIGDDERAHLVIFTEAEKTRQDTSCATLALAA